MATVTTPERATVAKKQQGGDRRPEQAPAFDRVEFQAPPNWVLLVDAAAEALGVSRSAYIRMAVNRQMDADRRAREG